jgi:hypothetical protein
MTPVAKVRLQVGSDSVYNLREPIEMYAAALARTPVPLNRRGSFSDSYTADYFDETVKSLDRIPVAIFLCGAGIRHQKGRTARATKRDIRKYIRAKLKSEIRRCEVRMGEHSELIRAYKEAVGGVANLADHEFALAKRKKMDLIVIFPCSPGSFAELGMFCIEDRISEKMRIFIDRNYRRSRGFLMEGPVKAAVQNHARVFFVDYAKRDTIWREIRTLVQEVKARKRKRKLLVR